MKKGANKVELVLAFDGALQLYDLPYSVRVKYQKDIYDDVNIESGRITISYCRSSSAKKGRAFNKTRITYVQSIILALSSSDACAHVLGLESALYSLNDGEAEELRLPDGLDNLKLDWRGVRFPTKAVKRSLGNDWVANSISIAISYCWAAARTFSQEERLKLLWGSFNALYRGYARLKKPDAKRLSEQDALDLMNGLLVGNSVLKQALQVFYEEIEPIGYKEFVQWKILTSPRSGSLYVKPDSDLPKEKGRRLALLDTETLENMRDCGCKNYKTKANLRRAVENQISNSKCETEPNRKVAMLLCRYIYIFRCEGVHAETVYPVFRTNGNNEKRVLADLLEAAVVDLADWFSENIAMG